MAHGDWTQYEWDVEEVSAADTDDLEEGEVIEHHHQPSAAECIKFMQSQAPAGSRWEMALVLDDQDGRSWAYVDSETMKLPERFEDAAGCETRKVPQRFHDELARAVNARG